MNSTPRESDLILFTLRDYVKMLISNTKKSTSPLWGSNPRPYAYEAHALPTELRRPDTSANRLKDSFQNVWFLANLRFAGTSDVVSLQDTVSERLRRWTRNPLGSARRGSNPLGVAFLLVHVNVWRRSPNGPSLNRLRPLSLII